MAAQNLALTLFTNPSFICALALSSPDGLLGVTGVHGEKSFGVGFFWAAGTGQAMVDLILPLVLFSLWLLAS